MADLTLENSTQSRGKIIVRIDNVNKSNDEIRMKIRARLSPIGVLCCHADNNPYFVISRARDPNSPNEFVRVF